MGSSHYLRYRLSDIYYYLSKLTSTLEDFPNLRIFAKKESIFLWFPLAATWREIPQKPDVQKVPFLLYSQHLRKSCSRWVNSKKQFQNFPIVPAPPGSFPDYPNGFTPKTFPSPKNFPIKRVSRVTEQPFYGTQCKNVFYHAKDSPVSEQRRAYADEPWLPLLCLKFGKTTTSI